MKLPDASWREREGLPTLLAALQAPEGRTRFVGGCVRDTLLGAIVSDIDLATMLLPDEVMDRVAQAGFKAVPTGIAHGTVTAVLPDGGPVEVTTLRRDVSTDGRRAVIAYTDSWMEDAARRDFTINALSADPESGLVHDYFGGLQDLRARRVRFIGDPLQRIAEDHLRILRFFRFHARFGAEAPDQAALDACTARANDLMALSRERIADELLKLLALSDPVATVALMERCGLFAPIIPEVHEEGVAALARTVTRERLIDLDPDPVRRLAALLPQVADTAKAVGARLKLSNEARARLEEYAAPGRHILDARHLAFLVGKHRAISLLVLAPIGDAELIAASTALRNWEPPAFPLKGGDLIALGLPKGPIVAKTLQALMRGWCEAGFPDEAKTRDMARAYVEQALQAAP